MGRMIAGAILIAIGALITIKSEAMMQNIGRIRFFEEKFGSYGGSRFGYKMIGIGISIFGILLFANLYSAFMEWTLSPLIDATNRGMEATK